MTTDNTVTVTQADFLKAIRQREVQMQGAAISLRDWHGMEVAYNALRDKIDAELTRLHLASHRTTGAANTPEREAVVCPAHGIQQAAEICCTLAVDPWMQVGFYKEKLERAECQLGALKDKGLTIIRENIALKKAALSQEPETQAEGDDSVKTISARELFRVEAADDGSFFAVSRVEPKFAFYGKSIAEVIGRATCALKSFAVLSQPEAGEA